MDEHTLEALVQLTVDANARVSATLGTQFVCLRYWYKSAHTDDTGRVSVVAAAATVSLGTLFACFTGTEVQILARGSSAAPAAPAATDSPTVSPEHTQNADAALLVQKYNY